MKLSIPALLVTLSLLHRAARATDDLPGLSRLSCLGDETAATTEQHEQGEPAIVLCKGEDVASNKGHAPKQSGIVVSQEGIPGRRVGIVVFQGSGARRRVGIVAPRGAPSAAGWVLLYLKRASPAAGWVLLYFKEAVHAAG